jgi:hypothetical protein
MGLGMASVSVVSLRLARPEDRGSVSASLQLCDTLASTLTIALGSAVYAVGRTSDEPRAFAVILVVMAGLALLGSLAAVRMRVPEPLDGEEARDKPVTSGRYRLRP